MIKVVDIFNTDYGAYRLLRTRVKKISMDNDFSNVIICPPGKWADRMEREGLKIYRVKMGNNLNPVSIFMEYRELKIAINEINPDILHTHTSKPGAIGRIVGRKIGLPLIIHQVHGFHFIHHDGLKRWFFESIEKQLAKQYTDILLFQNIDELNIAKSWGLDSQNVKLIYVGNGIPFEEFEEYMVMDKKLSKGVKKIICIARLEPVKNHKLLIKAVNILKKQAKIKFLVYLVGSGSLRSKLEALCERLNLTDVVKFLGVLDRKELIKQLFESDLSVLTSFKEGKPRALMESSLLGIPIVATNVVGTREVVKDGINGFLVSPDSPDELAEKITAILTDAELWSKLSVQARELARREFDEDRVVEKIKQIYREALKCRK